MHTENKPDRSIDRICKKFGNAAALSRALGHKNNGTVHHWVKTGYVPPKRIGDVKAAAEKLGITLIPKDFNQF